MRPLIPTATLPLGLVWAGVGSAGASGGSGTLSVGSNTWNAANNSLSAGKNLWVYDEASTVIGQWNKNTGTGTDEVFVIGIGSASPGANAMEVYRDGTVIINVPQGDISMGIFAPTP